MGNSIFDQAAKFIRDRRNNHRWLSIVLCLAIVVTVGTFYVLIRQGQAMIHRDQVLDCQLQVHVHDESCYDAENRLVCLYSDYVLHKHNEDCYDANGVLVCQLPEIEAHTHDDSCWLREQRLVCGLEETTGHVHSEECYTKEQGDMICALAEHTHTDACYSVPEAVQPVAPAEPVEGAAEGEAPVEAPAAEVPVVPAEPQLICGMEEHTHSDDCYTWNETLTCTIEEGTGHTHDESCYETVETLVCGKEEQIPHTHDENCQDENGFLICGTFELNEHMHTAECFRTIELTGDEVAGLNPEPTEEPAETEATEAIETTETTEAPEHEHDDSCYDEDGNLICEFAVDEEPVHVHGDDCYDEEGNLICELEGHEHDESCYDEEGKLICEFAPEEEQEHIHSDRCYDREGNLICGFEAHEHDDSCYDEEGKLICGHVTERSHEHDISCYDENGELICGFEDARDHEHDRRCYDENGELICGYEGMQDHVHSEDCYDEEGNLICGYEIEEEEEKAEPTEYTRVFQGEGYTITAIFGADAEIPEEAEFIAEQITPDTDGEHYAQREAEYQEAVEDENASMRALLKVGFYLDGVEIEPKSPVTLMIQFLDEDGLADGSPITIVHFADEGTEKLDGSRAENNSTTFQMESFSEIAIGYGQEEPVTAEEGSSSIYISRTFDYKDDAFRITFHIEGEATRADGEKFGITGKANKDSEGGKENAGDETETGETDTDSDESADDALAGSQNGEKDASVENTESSADQETAGDASSEEKIAEDGENTADDTDGVNTADNQKLEFQVEILGEDSTEYQTVENYVRTKDSASELLMVQVISYSLTYGGDELDLSECEVTAKITPRTNLEDVEPETVSEAASYTLYANEEAGVAVVSLGMTADASQAEAAGEEGVVDGKEDIVNDEEDSEETEVEETTDEETDESEDVTDQNGSESGSEDQEAAGGPEAGAGDEDTGSEDNETDRKPGTMINEDLLLEKEIVISAMELPEQTAVKPLGEITMSGDSQSDTQEYHLNSQVLALGAKSNQPNPKFTVQYYANLNILNTTGTNALPVIDTSKKPNDDKKQLPVNGKGKDVSPNGNPIKNIYVDDNGKVLTTVTPTEVYVSRPFEYIKAPSIKYMDALVENKNYDLKEIWVLKKDRDPKSVERGDWDIYTYSTDLHFTNRSVSGTATPGSSSGYIFIDDQSVMRFVYDVSTAEPDFKAAFYDYDITSGRLYTNVSDAIENKTTGTTQTGKQNNSTLYYAYTKEAGINSPGNYSGSGTKLAVGNVNTGTSMGENLWNGNLLNKFNGTQALHPTVTGSYKGCTFGLVTGLSSDGKIQYAPNVNAPKLFNEGGATGKTAYDNGEYTLKFLRSGDTYTLTAVNGTGATGLESFGHPSPNETTTHTHIWTNDFWPMDSAESFGTDGHDIKFGSYVYRENRAYAGSSTAGEPGSKSDRKLIFPYSDDGKDHNSYFGMHFVVEFELSKDYVGPLEYYFFGDDDMWVFLDNQLVCDIGGVHSSVGEYVNLWDYLEKGSEGKHKLSFFYTERGASGSTCWMQFTLPTVSSLTPETTDDDYGNLKIEKTVTKINSEKEETVDNNDEFSFTVHFTKDGKKLPDDYAYVKYDRTGKEIGSDLIIWDGGTFTLKNGEYIIVKYLPQGTRYEITESNQALTITDNTSEVSKAEYFTDITIADNESGNKNDLSDDKVAEGTISQGNQSDVGFNNKFYVYELPKTGGSGTTPYTVAGVLCILSGAGLMYRKKFRERRFKKAS